MLADLLPHRITEYLYDLSSEALAGVHVLLGRRVGSAGWVSPGTCYLSAKGGAEASGPGRAAAAATRHAPSYPHRHHTHTPPPPPHTHHPSPHTHPTTTTTTHHPPPTPPTHPPTHAAVFNQFYTECQVVGDEAEDSRLLLCEATARTMRACFALLGIHVPNCRI